jgi:hypothetical protein
LRTQEWTRSQEDLFSFFKRGSPLSATESVLADIGGPSHIAAR